MKHLFHIIILSVLCSTVACTHNGGDIGHLFGQWRLESISENDQSGNITSQQCDTVFWAFQSNICDIRLVDYNSYDYKFYTGLYEQGNNQLEINILSYMSYDIITAQDSASALRHLAPLYIDNLTPLFKINTLNRNEMILEYNNKYYNFKKLN